MERKKEVLEALAEWIIHTTTKSKKGAATSEEVEALPKVAEVFLKNYSSVVSFSPTNKEVTAGTATRRIESNYLANEVSIALHKLQPREEEFDQLIKRIKSTMSFS